MPGELQLFLHAHGVDADAGALDEALATAIRQREVLLRGAAATEFSKADLALLEGVGAEFEPAFSRRDDPLTRSIGRYAALIKSALSTTDLARAIGRTPARVRQMLLQRELYGIRPERDWLIPSFQVFDQRLLPGLARVVAAIPRQAHPLGVENFFLLPNEDLRSDEGAAMSPRDWLISGRDPEPVARMAADL